MNQFVFCFFPRLEVFKSLGKIEMIPVPYVTENVRICLVISVKSSDINRVMTFLKLYSINALEKKDLQFLMLVSSYHLFYRSNTFKYHLLDAVTIILHSIICNYYALRLRSNNLNILARAVTFFV